MEPLMPPHSVARVALRHLEAHPDYGESTANLPRGDALRKASTNTERDFYKATDGKWYVDNEAYDEDEDGEQIEGDMTSYGPFPSFTAAEKWMDRNFANSGGYFEDDSGHRRPPRRPVKPRASRWGAASRVADRHLEARNPPFHEAANADEAMGEAYRSLVDLKLGFDSWHEIPSSAQPLYSLIGKAISEVADARKETYQIRMMIQRKRYGAGPDSDARYAANVKDIQAMLDEISGHLARHEAKQAADTQDWGYAGDLDHAKTLLGEVTRFLSDGR